MYSGRKSPRKMVKNKTDLKFSPHRNRPLRRSLSRVRPTDSASSNSCANVKVVVRVRPPNQKELGNNSRNVVKVVDNNIVVFDPKEDDEPFFYHGVQQRGRDLLKKANKNIQFVFDRVFGFEDNNADVFDDSTKKLIQSLMDGYNCSVFVYGATGAGKTHTMLGHNGNPGITFLTMRELFKQMEELKEERDFELGITYVEVYNETVKDLLNPGPPLHLREDGKFGVCVAGIVLHRIKNPDDLFALLAKGNGNRTQHPTDANAESSRSHAVFQVYVNMITRNNGQRRISKLSMIDLAGSERGAATGCSGMRFTEGANINKSLLALGNCINSLADGHRHVPYRDSKLTRLLKDSLGGNCQTIMIANISPSSLNYEDTYNTLKYATRAKKIKSNMKKNLVSCELTLPQYAKLVEELNKENESLKAQLKAQTSTVTCSCRTEPKEDDQTTSSPKAEPTWRNQLRILLKEKVALQKQIERLVRSEEILKYRVKFKEMSESLMAGLCVDNELLESGRNRILNSMGTFQRQLSGALTELDEAKKQLLAVEDKIQTLIKNEEIPEVDNPDMLQSIVELKTDQYEIQVEHSTKIVELYQTEIEHNYKLMMRMSDVLKNYYQLLRGYGHVTDHMAGDYRSLVRMAQGIRSVKWQDEEDPALEEVKCKDSGISITATSTTDCSIKSLPTPTITITEADSATKRTTVKRKLYDSESQAASPSVKPILPEPDENENPASEPNLNETIVLPKSTINADAINSTFCLHDKEPVVPKKKIVLNDRSNIVSAENILPKAYKTITTKRRVQVARTNCDSKVVANKHYTTLSKTQRFPLRNKDQDSAMKSDRTTKVVSTNFRVNTGPSHRFKP